MIAMENPPDDLESILGSNEKVELYVKGKIEQEGKAREKLGKAQRKSGKDY